MEFRFVVVALALALSSCASAPESRPAPAPAVVVKPAPRALARCPDCGRVEKIEVVHGVRATAKGGAVLGGVVGGVVSQQPKTATPSKTTTTQTSYRLKLRMDDGRRIVVHQNLISPNLRIGSLIRYVGGRVFLVR